MAFAWLLFEQHHFGCIAHKPSSTLFHHWEGQCEFFEGSVEIGGESFQWFLYRRHPSIWPYRASQLNCPFEGLFHILHKREPWQYPLITTGKSWYSGNLSLEVYQFGQILQRHKTECFCIFPRDFKGSSRSRSANSPSVPQTNACVPSGKKPLVVHINQGQT